jgi:hypothetical protein
VIINGTKRFVRLMYSCTDLKIYKFCISVISGPFDCIIIFSVEINVYISFEFPLRSQFYYIIYDTIFSHLSVFKMFVG